MEATHLDSDRSSSTSCCWAREVLLLVVGVGVVGVKLLPVVVVAAPGPRLHSSMEAPHVADTT